jgi:hypothetical protein
MKRWYFISEVGNDQVDGKSPIIMFLKEIALFRRVVTGKLRNRGFSRLSARSNKSGCAITKRKVEMAQDR